MAYPGLDLGNIRFMLQGIRGCRRAYPMHPQSSDLDPRMLGIGRHDGINAIGREACERGTALKRHEQRHLGLITVMP